MPLHPQIQQTKNYLTGEEREYVINCIYPSQSLTLITAPPGAGKTKFALASAHAITNGHTFLDQYVQQGKVAYLNLDRMYKGDIEARLMDLEETDELGRWVDDIVWIEDDMDILSDLRETDEHGNIRFVRDEEQKTVPVVQYLIDHLKGYKLIVIDTWHKLCVNAGLSEDSSDDTDTLMIPVRKLATDTGAAVVILHHTPKHDPKHGRGSSAIEASVDHVLNIDGQARSEITLSCIKTRTDKIHIFPIEISDVFKLTYVDIEQMGQPIGAWKGLINQSREVQTEAEARKDHQIKQFITIIRKFGEKVGAGKYGIHRATLMAGKYKGKKAMLDQVLDTLRKHGRLNTSKKGANPFYEIDI